MNPVYAPKPCATSPNSTPKSVITIQEGSFLTLHYRLAGPDGADVINTFADKPATLSLGSGQLAPAMERCLHGLPEGTRQVLSQALLVLTPSWQDLRILDEDELITERGVWALPRAEHRSWTR